MADALSEFLGNLRLTVFEDNKRQQLRGAIERWHAGLPQVELDPELPEDPEARDAALWKRANAPRTKVRFPLPLPNDVFDGSLDARLVALAAMHDAAQLRDGRGHLLVENLEQYDGPLRHYATMVNLVWSLDHDWPKWLTDLDLFFRKFDSSAFAGPIASSTAKSEPSAVGSLRVRLYAALIKGDAAAVSLTGFQGDAPDYPDCEATAQRIIRALGGQGYRPSEVAAMPLADLLALYGDNTTEGQPIETDLVGAMAGDKPAVATENVPTLGWLISELRSAKFSSDKAQELYAKTGGRLPERGSKDSYYYQRSQDWRRDEQQRLTAIRRAAGSEVDLLAAKCAVDGATWGIKWLEAEHGKLVLAGRNRAEVHAMPVAEFTTYVLRTNKDKLAIAKRDALDDHNVPTAVTDKKPLTSSIETAWKGYQVVCPNLPLGATYADAYDALWAMAGELGYASKLPSKQTWITYVTKAASYYGKQKNQPRGRRGETARSVVRGSEL